MVANLRNLRLARGMSQQQLADVLGVSQQSINKYENHNTEPDVDTLIQLADYFGTTVDHLIGHSTPHKKSQPPELSLTREEAAFLRRFRRLSQAERSSIDLIVKNYLRNQ